MKIKWYNRKPMIAHYNIPVVMVRYIVPNHSSVHNEFAICNSVSPSKFFDTGRVTLPEWDPLEIADGNFPYKGLSLKQTNKEFATGELGVGSFDFEDVKHSKELGINNIGKLGYCTDIGTRAVPFDGEFIHMDKGTLPYYVVYMYGYIPQGCQYYIASQENGYFKHVKRYVSEKIIYLPVSDHKKITDLTGYNELLKYIN